MFSKFRGHETSRKFESSESPDGLDYNTSLAEVDNNESFKISFMAPNLKCGENYVLLCPGMLYLVYI